jgi:hypothetical protein
MHTEMLRVPCTLTTDHAMPSNGCSNCSIAAAAINWGCYSSIAAIHDEHALARPPQQLGLPSAPSSCGECSGTAVRGAAARVAQGRQRQRLECASEYKDGGECVVQHSLRCQLCTNKHDRRMTGSSSSSQ